MDNNFTLFCISNGSELEFPQNTLTNFKNKLPLNLEIKRREHSKWCMALESICFSTSFGNIKWPFGPSFITISLDFVDNLYRNNFVMKEKIERQSVTEGIDRANFEYLDTELRELLKLGRNPYGGDGERYYYEGYQSFARQFRMPDICYYYPDDFFCNLDSLGLYFEKIAKKSNMKMKRTETSIELIPNIDKTNLECWFLINTKLIYDGPFQLKIEHTDTQYLENHRLTTAYYFVTDIKHKERNLLHIGDEYYKPIFMCGLVKKLTLTIVKTEPEIFLPKIVKVRCENVKHQIFDDEYSKDLVVFCPSLKHDDKYFYKEFNTKSFIPISNTTLNHIDIKLLDQANRPIKLVDGYATIVKLHLLKMPSNRKFFNVRLTSQKSKLFPENTKSSFKVSLPNTLNFNSEWKVSVTSINHPTVFNNFPDGSKITFVKENDKVYSYSLKSKYLTKEELFTDLNSLFSKHNFMYVTHDLYNNRLIKTVRFNFVTNGVFIISAEVANVLGCSKSSNESGVAWLIQCKPDSSEVNGKSYRLDFENPIDLDFYKPNYVMMYSNIVSPTILGGEFKNILKVFPILSSEKHDYQIQEFKHFEYYNLANLEIKDIEIYFRSHCGDRVYFGGEYEVIVNLLFTNYEY